MSTWLFLDRSANLHNLPPSHHFVSPRFLLLFLHQRSIDCQPCISLFRHSLHSLINKTVFATTVPSFSRCLRSPQRPRGVQIHLAVCDCPVTSLSLEHKFTIELSGALTWLTEDSFAKTQDQPSVCPSAIFRVHNALQWTSGGKQYRHKNARARYGFRDTGSCDRVSACRDE